MFSWFKADPLKKLDKQYKDKLEEAMLAQRAGNIEKYSELTVEAQAIAQQIQLLNRAKA
ncbi:MULTISPECIES: DUF6435 family protein [unclassified Neptuniibacter]|uniref:DUF6435 family protein n=1 Tax=unclassified Neptuniibacter TaxID=2630693 RepID=UPI0025E84E0A|nr:MULTISPECIES: DUF6435 family protein [unclassified Neptuniibacter]|tara:strand:- start:5432 stop:5608 length:177 start_codon:yes stop_codon:yes gene_type:complete